MTKVVRLNTAHREALETAYLYRPEAGYGQSSYALYKNDLNHFVSTDGLKIVSELAELGYLRILENRDAEETDGSKFRYQIFCLTPLGIAEAEASLGRRRAYSASERLSAVSRSDWIALIALTVSIIAIFVAGR